MADTPHLTISALSRRTGIPVTTLRFYERELPGLFRVRTTPGGHRRYTDAEADRFGMVRRLSSEGMGLREIRGILRSAGDAQVLREIVEAADERLEDALRRLAAAEARLGTAEARLDRLERGGGPRRGWFGRRRRSG
ncbi:MAG TPA: MerR family transcriptional regulator [Thermoanaerobaculia bacterium]|jgi:DNA-binding transcriptional MerR regulator